MWRIKQSQPDLFYFLRNTYEREYKELNAINLTKFYDETTPIYYVFHCGMPDINCRQSWKVKKTPFGTCLRLDVREVYQKAIDDQRNENQRKKGKVHFIAFSS